MEYYDKWKKVFKEIDSPGYVKRGEDIVPPEGLDLDKKIEINA